MSRVDFAVVVSALLPLAGYLVFIVFSAAKKFSVAAVVALLLLLSLCCLNAIAVLDTALIAGGRAKYELHESKDGTRSWVYVEIKRSH